MYEQENRRRLVNKQVIPVKKAVNQKVTKRCLPGLGYIHHYRCATGEVPYPRADIGKFSNIILL